MNSRLKFLHLKAEQARETHAYRAEGASIRFSEHLVTFMNASGLTRSALTKRIGSSPAYITKILSGQINSTLESIVKITNALNCELTIGLQPLTSTVSDPSIPLTKVSYHQIAPRPSSMLNDQPYKYERDHRRNKRAKARPSRVSQVIADQRDGADYVAVTAGD